jgi:hypothetical protein
MADAQLLANLPQRLALLAQLAGAQAAGGGLVEPTGTPAAQPRPYRASVRLARFRLAGRLLAPAPSRQSVGFAMFDADDWDDHDQDDGGRERGKYATFLVWDKLHCQLMTVLRRHAGQEPESRLWLAVIEYAVADVYVLKGASMDPEDRRWYHAGMAHAFLRSARCVDVCHLAGLDPEFFRRTLKQYEAARHAHDQAADRPRPGARPEAGPAEGRAPADPPARQRGQEPSLHRPALRHERDRVPAGAGC